MFSQGFCTALMDTDFGDKQCPFFEKKKANNHDIPEGPLTTVNRWTKLPRLNLRLESIMNSADKKKDLYTVDSENSAYKFIADKDSILILSNKSGYLRVPLEEIDDLAREAAEVAEAVRIWKRGKH